MSYDTLIDDNLLEEVPEETKEKTPEDEIVLKKRRGRPKNIHVSEEVRNARNERYRKMKEVDPETGISEYDIAIARQTMYVQSGKVRCEICNKDVIKHYLEKHNKTQTHTKNKIYSVKIDLSKMSDSERIRFLEEKIRNL